MIHLPLYLEKKLKQLMPKAQDRYDFVSSLVKEALETMSEQQQEREEERQRPIGGTLHLFTDGGSRGNPGEAAIGYIIEDPATGTVLQEGGACIGHETNNVAEYQALIEGIKAVSEFHPSRLICHLDSELIVKQLNGQYKVKTPSMKEYFEQVAALVEQFSDITFRHIPRSDNYRADAKVNQALDAAGY